MAGMVGIAVVLAGCPQRGLDAPPAGPTAPPAGPTAPPAGPTAPPAELGAPTPGKPATRTTSPRPRGTAPASAPTDGTDLVAVPPWVDLEDPKDQAWVEGMRRALRAVAPQAAKCHEEAAEAVPGCLCKVICGVKFPRLKAREGHREISYPPLPGGPSLRGFRLRADGAVESCTIRSGDASQPGARTTEIVWCAEEIGGGEKR
jgi:hypothetical protein